MDIKNQKVAGRRSEGNARFPHGGVRWAAAVVSGLLLFCAFPPLEKGFAGWVALVPLVLACAGVPARRAVGLGFLCGAVFFLTTLHWIRYVTWAGMIGLALYCALYIIPFAWFIHLRDDGWRSSKAGRNLLWAAGAAGVWVAGEYARAVLFTGFPWNLLGVSQYRQIPLIQIVEWGGVYLLSGLMVLVNVAVASTIMQYVAGLRGRSYRVHTELLAVLLLTAGVWSIGMNRLLDEDLRPRGDALRLALIQPNVPEVGNWELADPELIYERLETLSDLATRTPGLDLMIWPETALPDFARVSVRSSALIRRMTATGVPLLAGSMDVRYRDRGQPEYTNASMLFDQSGKIIQSYDKQHLVLFGEYIPFEERIPLINALTPIHTSFTPGRESTLFTLPHDPRPFSVLICFEDVLPYLSRQAVRAGALWLVNQTNDSWFDPSSGSKQHLANAVFRAVETRRPLVRCANTGVTGVVDAFGRVHSTLAVRTTGFQIAEVTPADPGAGWTFYVRVGDRFAQLCVWMTLLCGLAAWIQRRRFVKHNSNDGYPGHNAALQEKDHA